MPNLELSTFHTEVDSLESMCLGRKEGKDQKELSVTHEVSSQPPSPASALRGEANSECSTHPVQERQTMNASKTASGLSEDFLTGYKPSLTHLKTYGFSYSTL